MACPGVIPPWQWRWASVKEWRIKWRGKGTRELKMPDITGKQSEFRKNDKSSALGLPTGMRFIFQNRYLENWVLQEAVCVWVLVMGLTPALWDHWPEGFPRDGEQWASGSCQDTKAGFSPLHKAKLRNTCCALLGWGGGWPSHGSFQFCQKLGTFSEMAVGPNKRNTADLKCCGFYFIILLG